jgi:hypothetical protein
MIDHNYFILIVCWAGFDPKTFGSDAILNICANKLHQKPELMEKVRQLILTNNICDICNTGHALVHPTS